MAPKVTLTKSMLNGAFNKGLFEFFDALESIDDAALKQQVSQARRQARLLLAADDRMASRLFAAHVAEPYQDRISARDEDFFLTAAPYAATRDLDILGFVQRGWRACSGQERQVVWEHLQSLCSICRAMAVADK
jgi:hypothetical protein